MHFILMNDPLGNHEFVLEAQPSIEERTVLFLWDYRVSHLKDLLNLCADISMTALHQSVWSRFKSCLGLSWTHS